MNKLDRQIGLVLNAKLDKSADAGGIRLLRSRGAGRSKGTLQENAQIIFIASSGSQCGLSREQVGFHGHIGRWLLGLASEISSAARSGESPAI